MNIQIVSLTIYAVRPFYGTYANRIAPDVTPQNAASSVC